MALAIACLIPVLLPGDAAFINDEPILISRAVQANQDGRLVQAGLLGTWGFTYGPAPTWVYQLLAAVTHDLVTLVALHAALMGIVTAAALWWLSRSLGLWMWFAPVPLLSPYFWFYARVLWDNPLLLPLGALAMAGYAAHLRSGSSTGLRVAVAAVLTMPLVHLVSLALVLPLGAHMVLVRWRSLWAHKWSVTGIAATLAALAWPYWIALAGSRSHGAVSRDIRGWLFPFSGGRLLSARDLEYFYGARPVDGSIMALAAAGSWLAYALVIAGIGVAAWMLVRAARAWQWTPRAHIAGVALASVACQAVVSGLTARFEHPHYLNGIWISCVLLAWLTADAMASRDRLWRLAAVAVTATLAVSLMTSVGVLATRLHRSGGTREVYGPTIANQQAVARALTFYAPQSAVRLDVIHYQRFPHALETLRQLNPGQPDARERDLEIRYASDDPASGVIELVRR